MKKIIDKIYEMVAIIAFCTLAFFAIRATIKYPMESGLYIFTAEGRKAHRAEVRRNESVSAYNKRIDRKRTPEEREYQEWKKSEDEYRLRVEKEKRFLERYEGRKKGT